MYVQKFESETLDGALKDIKRELGPDAIILKTVSNKGIKGAFKKSKIEITAAISEKNISQKSKVDKVLNDDEKESFYNSESQHISKMIKQFDNEPQNQQVSDGYGKISLNKSANIIPSDKKTSSSSLDSFLAGTKKTIESTPHLKKEQTFSLPSTHDNIDKINELEQTIFALKSEFAEFVKPDPVGIQHLMTTLRSYKISEAYIRTLVKKAMFELKKEDQNDHLHVFEFALREMLEVIKTEMPLFSSANIGPSITVFISDIPCGQSSMGYKIAALKKDVAIVRFRNKRNGRFNLTETVFGVNVYEVESISDVVAKCGNLVDEGKTVFVDYKIEGNEFNDTKRFLDGMRRAFSSIEVLATLSSLHSEQISRNFLSKYQNLLNGSVVSFVDSCVDFGALFNLSESFPALPYKFFGTGKVIPEDIESATAERILDGIFNL